MALHLAKAAKNAGHSVTIGAPEDNVYIKNAKAQGFETYVYKAPKSLLPTGGKILNQALLKKFFHLIFSLLPYNFKIWHRLKTQKIDLAYIAQERGVLQIGVGVRLAGIPLLWHMQGGLSDKATKLHQIAAALSKRIICVSNAVKDDLEQFISPKAMNKASLLYNGLPDIDLPEQEINTHTTILFAGNVTPERGIHVLLEAAISLPQNKTEIKIAGWLLDEEYETYLRRLIARQDSQNVELLGYQENIDQLMVNADIIVCPTIDKGLITLNKTERALACKEGFGLSALEAMRAGKPVICSAVGGLKEVVENNVTGLHVPSDDVRALDKALQDLHKDPALRHKMGKAGRARYKKHFTEDKMIHGFLNLLEELNV